MAAAAVVPPEYLTGFVLVTSLFALWGFANDVSNPMVSAFRTILLLTNTESALVQTAFYGGYCFMSIPAALVIKRFTYKTGILIGLLLYSLGCLLFIPAAAQVPTEEGSIAVFSIFLLAYFVMTCGLSFLETSANPYILSMGPEQTATPRLNLAQAFNPLGSLCGMSVARTFVLSGLNIATEEERERLLREDFEEYRRITEADLGLIRTPYAILGIIVAVVFCGFLCARLPQTEGGDKAVDFCGTVGRITAIPYYVKGVVTQSFYVGAQICCWTFIIQYGEMELSLTKGEAQNYNIIAMIIFVGSRFACTYLLRFVSSGCLLAVLGVAGAALCLGAVVLPGVAGLWSLVLVSACLSLMFPTIYGIALDSLGDDAKLASAGLILAIGGGAIFPAIQARIIDTGSVRASFSVPLVCLAVVAIYGIDTVRTQGSRNLPTDGS